MKEQSWIELPSPFHKDQAKLIKAGDMLLLTGTVYTARDRAHQRLSEMLMNGQPLPVDLRGQIIYYAGPAPAPPGHAIGSAGPTTSYRMDPFTQMVCDLGVLAMIGKGKRDSATRKIISECGLFYFSSIGGAGAYLSNCITRADVVAFEDLGPEAIYRLEIQEFPVICINDPSGADLYERQTWD